MLTFRSRILVFLGRSRENKYVNTALLGKQTDIKDHKFRIVQTCFVNWEKFHERHFVQNEWTWLLGALCGKIMLSLRGCRRMTLRSTPIECLIGKTRPEKCLSMTPEHFLSLFLNSWAIITWLNKPRGGYLLYIFKTFYGSWTVTMLYRQLLILLLS